MGTIREPIKKSSIKKKEQIIKSGFNLMCEKGYHNVTSIDIAKSAGVSTGIIYQYFKDKRDIFIEGIKDYANSIMFPLIDIQNEALITKKDLENLILNVIDNDIKTHKIKKVAHEELMAMSNFDDEISKIFKDNEMIMTNKFAQILISNGFKENHIKEKVHIALGLIDNYCHEVVYHKHEELNREDMKEEILKIIVNMLV